MKALFLSSIALLAFRAHLGWAAPGAAAVTHGRTLPACSEKEIGNCTCSNGTEYQAAKTYAVIGANAQDFQKLYGSCMLSRCITASGL